MKQLRQSRIDPEKLRSVRETAGLNQTEAAERLNISKQRLNAYEQGKDRMFGDILVSMCEIYNVGVEAFKKDDILTPIL